MIKQSKLVYIIGSIVIGIVSIIGIIIGVLIVVGIIATVICSITKTPDHLRGYYGSMFWTIATVAIVGLVALVILGLF